MEKASIGRTCDCANARKRCFPRRSARYERGASKARDVRLTSSVIKPVERAGCGEGVMTGRGGARTSLPSVAKEGSSDVEALMKMNRLDEDNIDYHNRGAAQLVSHCSLLISGRTHEGMAPFHFIEQDRVGRKRPRLGAG